MSILYIIRHGQTSWNRLSLKTGSCNIPTLDNYGIKQAENIAKALSNVRFDYFYCSPLRRAIQTAEIILKNRKNKIIIINELKELDTGILQGLSNDFIRKNFAWYNKYNEQHRKKVGAESFSLAIKNMKEKIIPKLISHKDSTIAIVSHKTRIETLLLALGLQKDNVLNKIKAGSFIKIRYEPPNIKFKYYYTSPKI